MIESKTMHLVLIIVGIIAVIIAVLAYMAGQQEGAAAAAALAAASAEFWRRRGGQDQEIDDAIERGTAAGEDIRSLGADAEAVVDKNREEVSASSGEDKASEIDRLTS